MRGFFIACITGIILFGGIYYNLTIGVDNALRESDSKIYDERIQLACAIHNELRTKDKIYVPVPILVHMNCPNQKFVKKFVTDNNLNTSNIGVWLAHPNFTGWEYKQIQNFISFYKEQS